MIFSRIIKPQEIDINGIMVSFQPSSRASRLILRYKNGFICSVPHGCALSRAREFATQQTAWMVNIQQKLQIRQQISHIQPQMQSQIQPGQSIILYGVEYQITQTEGRGVNKIDGQHIVIFGAQSLFRGRLRRLIYDHADQIFRQTIQKYCAILGMPCPPLVVRDTHSRWGSCRNDGGRISLSPRLLFAPPEICDYVIAHECAHLLQANHSDKFWAVVGKIDPLYTTHRQWLKKNGDALLKISI